MPFQDFKMILKSRLSVNTELHFLDLVMAVGAE